MDTESPRTLQMAAGANWGTCESTRERQHMEWKHRWDLWGRAGKPVQERCVASLTFYELMLLETINQPIQTILTHVSCKHFHPTMKTLRDTGNVHPWLSETSSLPSEGLQMKEILQAAHDSMQLPRLLAELGFAATCYSKCACWRERAPFCLCLHWRHNDIQPWQGWASRPARSPVQLEEENAILHISLLVYTHGLCCYKIRALTADSALALILWSTSRENKTHIACIKFGDYDSQIPIYCLSRITDYYYYHYYYFPY